MDRKRITIIFLGGVLLLLGGIGLYLLVNLQKNSGLRVEAFPKSKIIIDGKEMGETPFYKEGLTPKEYTVKVAPETGNLTPYETKIRLNPQTLTILTRVFNTRDEFSSGQLVTLEKNTSDNASISLVSDPDAALVQVDGQDKGISPLEVRGFTAGTHEIVVAKPGFDSQTINGTLIKGYDLRIFIKLPKAIDGSISSASSSGDVSNITSTISINASPAAQKATPESTQPPQVIILPTPTGFLRVRNLPSATSTESAKVKPGQKFLLLEEQPGWFRIQVASVSGWVSSDYAEKSQ